MGDLRVAVAVVASLVLVGCFGGEDQPTKPSDGANTAGLDCPGGGEDVVTVVFDLGENPHGTPTARGALERFLSERRSDLSADEFRRTARPSAGTTDFAYTRDGLKLVHIYAERLERGWHVISYAFCRGVL
jgi:hypothetical protein